MTQDKRVIQEVLSSQSASDGAGMRLKRVFGGRNLDRFDPFLMLDEFGSFDAADYIGGFPSHPHRGFETVTDMLEAYMEHRDHIDNLGRLGPGDVQWITAGSGVIHSEMPQQKEGRMRGFQLWVNLPAAEKMIPASYQNIGAQDIPQYQMDHIGVRAIAGRLMVNEQEVIGAVTHPSTEPGYLDLQTASPDAVRILIPDGHNALLYVYEGSLTVSDHDYRLKAGKMGRLSHHGLLVLQAEPYTRALVISGKPIGEPIVHYGPFVMNTMAEIKQAVTDYNSGKLM